MPPGKPRLRVFHLGTLSASPLFGSRGEGQSGSQETDPPQAPAGQRPPARTSVVHWNPTPGVERTSSSPE